MRESALPQTENNVPTTIACVECMSLVGASRLQEPHRDLFPLAKPSDPADLFQCSGCDSRWVVGALGWSKYVD